jgi:hypothetical protein
MIHKSELCSFLVRAKKSTYASEDESKKIFEKDTSTTLIFEEGDYKYHDNYFGGEPFGGREIVFFQGKPLYIMTYYGRIYENMVDGKEIYKILQQALTLIPEEKPYRGPKEYKEGDYIYTNDFVGEVDNFSGEETITLNGKKIYKAQYVGGLVDQKNPNT